MNASGLLWGDSALEASYLYVFGGVGMLMGWAACLFLGFAQQRWSAAGACAVLGALPILYIMGLGFLGRSVASPASSNIAFLAVMCGMLLAVVAGPISALVLIKPAVLAHEAWQRDLPSRARH
ncbi:hypothetical protein D3C86_1227560 [compost metagenome]